MRYKKNKKLRIIYACGPGDVVGTYKYWKEGKHDPRQLSITYSYQFYDACEKLDANAYLISSNENTKHVDDNRFIIEHRPNLWAKKTGIKYHFGKLFYGFRFVLDSIKYNADIAIVSLGDVPMFPLILLKIYGIKVVPTIHNVLWCKYKPINKKMKLLLFLSSIFYKYGAFAIMCVSNEIARQIKTLVPVNTPPLLEFLPIYEKDSFSDIKPYDLSRNEFSILYIGRIEKSKGVYDLLDLVNRLKNKNLNIKFDLCGEGSELTKLNDVTKTMKLENVFHLHGHCKKEYIKTIISKCSVIIVPTTSEFTEGFAKTVAEGVLAKRPVIASTVCPAVEYFGESVIKIAPGDLDAYEEIIQKLYLDHDYYKHIEIATNKEVERFYDIKRGWGFALQSILYALNNEELPSAQSWYNKI